MNRYANVLGFVGLALASLLGYSEACSAQISPVTAIDIAIEPDATMVHHAAANSAGHRTGGGGGVREIGCQRGHTGYASLGRTRTGFRGVCQDDSDGRKTGLGLSAGRRPGSKMEISGEVGIRLKSRREGELHVHNRATV